MNVCGRILSGLLFAAFGALLLQRPALSVEAVKAGLSVCASSLIPSLFPFFVLSHLWIHLGHAERLCSHLTRPMAVLFHLPANAALPLIQGAIGGYPLGVMTTVSLYREGLLQKEASEQCLLFCCNAGPAFIVGLVGSAIFHDVHIGFLLWAIHLAAAFLIGIIFRPSGRPPAALQTKPAQVHRSFLITLTKAVQAGSLSIFHVCGFVLFFSVLTRHLSAIIPGDSACVSLLLAGLELTGGLYQIDALPCSEALHFILSAALLGWGGLCVHCQSLSFLADTDLRTRFYWFGKFLHCIVSAALAAGFLLLKAQRFSHISYILPLFVLLLVFLMKTASGKMKPFPL